MTLSVDRATPRPRRAPVPVRALLVDHQSKVLGSTCPGRGAGHLFARRMIRGSLDRLRLVGVRIAVVCGDPKAPWPPRYEVVESILGPVDLWCGTESPAAPAVSEDATGHLVIAAAAMALGLELRTCAVATDDARLAVAARHAGARVMWPGVAEHRGRSHHTALALSGAVEHLVAELLPSRPTLDGPALPVPVAPVAATAP